MAVRGRSRIQAGGLRSPDPALLRMLCLAGCMVVGMAAGWLYAARCGDSGFADYLSDFCGACAGEPAPVSLLSAVRLYFGYVALAVLLGFASVGVALIPLLSGAYGFVSMFAVACFVEAYGRQGALMALGAMGLRHLFVIPCFLWAATRAWTSADRLMGLSLGRGKRCSPVAFDGGYWYRLALCVVILLAGLCVELYVTPHLFALTVGA